MARYFRLPFAVNGDKDILPDNTVNTAVSYDTGYTPDYQRDPVTDPLARNPERNIFNQLMFDITDTLRDLYETGAPPFIAPSDNNNQPFLYPQGALVRFNNRVYESLTGNNGTTPSDTDNWQPIDIAGNDARYLLESNNLSDLADPTAARANLSISSTAETDARYLQEANNLSDLSDAATARTNLQLGTAAQSNVGTGPSDLITTSEADSRFDGRYLNESANLSDLPNAATARNNLSVYSRADTYTRTESDVQYLNEASNLSDLPSVSSARNNLGLGSSAVVDTGTGSSQIPTTSQADARYLQEASNLSDLDNAATARTNLELGTAAQSNVGTGPSDLITTSEADSRFDGRYLNESANLSDLPNAATARNNLSVYSRADTYTRTESDAQYLNEASNLSDLPSVSSARNNLGLGSSAVVDTGTGSSQIPTTSLADARYLQEASNLSDLDNAATARTNLELGTAAQAQVSQFIYPNSGVLGSIDKNDLFTYTLSIGQQPANALHLRQKQFNIGGRFVETQSRTFLLPPAETTASRAVAFDDIFLDWNGNVVTHRSIIPHRTTTGFDADQIATDAGYTRVSQGLYSRAGNHALLLARISRRNQGAYHPFWNPEGSAGVRNSANTGTVNWYNNPTATSSQSDAFVRSGGANNPDNNSGAISQFIGRPDGLFYDAIYADDITPLYFSARAVTDRKALLIDNTNRAISGETFMGAEGTPTTGLTVSQVEVEPSGTALIRFTSPIINAPDTQDELGIVFNLSNGEMVSNIGTTQNQHLFRVQSGDAGKFSAGNIVAFTNARSIYFTGYPNQPSARPQFLYVDIIGATTAMPQEWLDNGIPGNWLAVGEEGEDLIPDGTTKFFKGSRKVLEFYLALATNDRGLTWTDVTREGISGGWHDTFESPANGSASNRSANDIRMLFYRTSANPFELASSAEIYSIDAYCKANAFNSAFGGALFVTSLINKVSTGTVGHAFDTLGITRIPFSPSSLVLGSGNAFEPLTNIPHTINGQVTPALKVYPYIARNGFLNCIYKELRYNGTSWGDDNQFNIIDNQSTVPDNNGQQVIVGQKRVALPYIFDGDLY